MNKFLSIAIFILFGNMVLAQDIYVSPSGMDSGKGSFKSPYKTLGKALEKAKKIKGKNSKRAVSISLREGVYDILETIALGAENSFVKIEAYKGEKVVFSGGQSIPLSLVKESNLGVGFDKSNHTIYEVDLRKVGITNFGTLRNVGFSRPYGPAWGELFVNKKAMHLARWPNEGMVPMGKVLEKGSIPREDDFSDKGGVIAYDSLRINTWAKEKNAWMAGYFMHGYADDMVKIKSIDTLKQTLTTASATLYGYGDGKPWQKWYGVNILAELDAPGEYYVDKEKGLLYFASDEKEIASLEFSVLERPFFQIEDAEGIVIRGISFQNSRGMGIAMTNTKGVIIEACNFKNLGSLGISVGKGIEAFAEYRHEGTGTVKTGEIGSLLQHLYSNTTFNREGGSNNKIVNCTFSQLGAGGVSLGGGNRLTLEPGNNVVEDCLFFDINRIEKSYRPAVHLTGVGNKVLHNEMYDLPSVAILMHGNNHTIEYNYIHEVCLEVEDMGAIYYGRDPSERGTIVRYNYIANIPDEYNTSAVYHDDAACGLTVTDNIFYKAGKLNVLIGGGSDNIYKNNFFIESKVGVRTGNRLQTWAKWVLEEGGLFQKRMAAVNYAEAPYVVQYPTLKNYFENAEIPTGNLVAENVFINVKEVFVGKKEWLGYSDSNVTATKDLPNINSKKEFQDLLEDIIPGVKNIPIQKIGLKSSKGRR
ncbi:right-handed parallel beta-helix repeat-containing protein [Arenibacter sp. 6A1]|uniref:right-handed parallel beta-helix repeat-containing protein n=1 Tax=Arenibacter sp. 6A1 TaxID=2720391 RepID=UPI0014451515|nr:right-handed parallel beta-helix repeat-containing protein [Arenibacter sp. 6A1]NKI26992.1 right-handed parallel beta-helix repeat-containing protein [Arenibacter sp. 6A1]